MDTTSLLRQIETHVKYLFANYETSNLLYHNLSHTQLVVSHVGELAKHYQLNSDSTFLVTAAAWFHDSGQLSGDIPKHEERSVQFMEAFFSDNHIDHEITAAVAQLIMATKMPVNPSTLLEEIICDADTWHLGTNDFYQLDPLVWDELELRFDIPIENKLEKSLTFLELHQFYTDYCIEKLSEGKKQNIESLRTILHSSPDLR